MCLVVEQGEPSMEKKLGPPLQLLVALLDGFVCYWSMPME